MKTWRDRRKGLSHKRPTVLHYLKPRAAYMYKIMIIQCSCVCVREHLEYEDKKYNWFGKESALLHRRSTLLIRQRKCSTAQAKYSTDSPKKVFYCTGEVLYFALLHRWSALLTAKKMRYWNSEVLYWLCKESALLHRRSALLNWQRKCLSKTPKWPFSSKRQRGGVGR